MSLQRTRVPRPVRRVRHASAWIVRPGQADQECQVLDVSAEGAKVIAAIPASIPNRFELALSQGDSKRRLCDVIWRRGKMVGVLFADIL